MTALAGMVYHDPSRAPGPALHPAARSLPSDGPAGVAIHEGPLTLYATEGGTTVWTTDATILALDADLVNGDELRALTRLDEPAAMVASLYEREGPSGIQRLRGAFSLALWDRRHRRLLLAVDQVGIKRLYYATTRDGFAFASRPTALLGMAGLAPAADATSLYQYLNFGCVPAPHAAFLGVRRLPPAHWLTLVDGQPSTIRYWNLSYSERPLDLEQTCAATFRFTEEAVSRALGAMTAKEAGAFLSGGTDSSTVLGLMARTSGERIHAFSIGFEEPRYDEMDYARVAARHFDAAHYTRVVTAADALAALPRLVGAYDEPFGNNSAIGTLFCAQLAHETGIKTLLAGDGGDEIFGGNEHYRTDRVLARYQRIPALLRRGLVEPVLLGLPDGRMSLLGKAQRYVRRASVPAPRRFYSAYAFFFAEDGRPLLDPDFVRAAGPDAPWRLVQTHFAEAGAATDLNRRMYLDLKLILADNDLFKVTRTAELGGVGVRFPLLDLPLVEFTGTWPSRYKVRGLEKRWLFKRAFRTLLPAEILAKRKHGFGVPTSSWLRSNAGFRALLRDTLGSTRARQRGWLAAGALDELLRRQAADPTPFYGDVLWTVLMLELWHQRHIDARGGP